MTETINGLHSCKPGNDPVVGQVQLFVIEHRTGKNNKPYIKIKRANEENGGTPHRILSAEPTGYTDKFGNISFNIEVEASSSPPSAFQQTKAAMQQGEPPPYIPGDWPDVEKPPVNAPQSPVGFSGKHPLHDPLDIRQRAIIRQHSQSMALEVLKLKVTLNELTVEDLTPAKLRQLADYFDQDVYGAAQ